MKLHGGPNLARGPEFDTHELIELAGLLGHSPHFCLVWHTTLSHSLTYFNVSLTIEITLPQLIRKGKMIIKC